MTYSLPTDVPVLDIDPFGEDFQRGPDLFYERLRDAGPVVFLERYRVWAMARFAEVHAALRDHESFSSAAGVGLTNFWKEEPWRPPSLLLEADPPEHTRVRRITTRAMSPRAIEGLRPEFERQAEDLVTTVVARAEFDGVTELAQAYPLRVFPDAVGVGPHGRENLLLYGDMVFNGFGPRNQLFEEAMAPGAPVRDWIAEQCRRASLAPGGLGAGMYAAVDRGEITEDEAGLLVRSLLSAGIDTTVHAIAWTLHMLATQPGQWAALRDDPTLARPAFEETLRYASPVQLFLRATTREVRVADTVIPAGEKVVCFLAAANRDPREYDDPDRFDIRRRTVSHLAFGSGIHACVGAAIARLEAEILLTALARHVRTLELAGPPRPRRNNVLKALARLPLRVRAA
ncbi:MAG: cytochrome P450 [Streptosporangiales bacterium]|nr:cytochrome P450 [Streptosporangiales bacterium]